MGLGEVFSGLVIERSFKRDLKVIDDGVQRCANLVS